MSDFFRFPHTPHLAWLGAATPREDKLLPTGELSSLLEQEFVVEEKIDGANLGISTDEAGELRVQNRGSWLSPDTCHPQFRSLWSWLGPKRSDLENALGSNLMLFGEWCVAVHTVEYNALPDWFLGFDVFERSSGRFWSTIRRDALLNKLGLRHVPLLGRGIFGVDELRALMDTSRVGSSAMEGVYVRAESSMWLRSRAKLVRPEFAQGIDTHWSHGTMHRNCLSPTVWN